MAMTPQWVVLQNSMRIEFVHTHLQSAYYPNKSSAGAMSPKKFGDHKFALWLCPRIFPMCYQTAGGLTQYLDRADSADAVFTHTVYE